MKALIIRVGPAYCSSLMSTTLRVSPAGCLAVGSYLKKKGLDVDLWDIPIKFGIPHFKKSYENRMRDISASLRGNSYDLIGLSITSGTEYLNALDVASTIKEELDGVPILAGGYHASAIGRDLFSDTIDIDIVLRGEGEPIIDPLLERLPELDFSGIPNLIWRDSQGAVKENEMRPIYSDVQKLPFFDVDLLENPGIYTIGVALEGSRGCPHTCSFCPDASTQGVDWSAKRLKTPKRLADEIEHVTGRLLARGYKPQYFMSDLTFGIQRNWTIELCEELVSRNLPIGWACETRVGCLSYDELRLMSKVGCEWVNYGIESGSPLMLRLMGKTSRPEAYLESAVKSISDTVGAGLSAHATFLIGYPGETHQTLTETSSFVNRLLEIGEGKFLPWFFLFYPYPGTLAWEMMPEYEKRFGTKMICGEWWRNREYAGYWGEAVTVVPSEQLTAEEMYSWKVNLSKLSGPPFTF